MAKDAQILLRVTEDVRSEWNRKALDAGMSLSEWIRGLDATVTAQAMRIADLYRELSAAVLSLTAVVKDRDRLQGELEDAEALLHEVEAPQLQQMAASLAGIGTNPDIGFGKSADAFAKVAPKKIAASAPVMTEEYVSPWLSTVTDWASRWNGDPGDVSESINAVLQGRTIPRDAQAWHVSRIAFNTFIKWLDREFPKERP